MGSRDRDVAKAAALHLPVVVKDQVASIVCSSGRSSRRSRLLHVLVVPVVVFVAIVALVVMIFVLVEETALVVSFTW